MGKYNMVSSGMWADNEFRALSPSGKLLYNYLLSSPVSNLAGFYRLEVIQIKTNLCRYDRRMAKFVSEDEELFESEILPMLVEQKHLWMYDIETEQVLIPNYLKYNQIGGPKQIAAVMNAIRGLTICDLHIDFFCSLIAYVGDRACDQMDPATGKAVLRLCQESDRPEAKDLADRLCIYSFN